MRLKRTKPAAKCDVLRRRQILITEDKYSMFGNRLLKRFKDVRGTGIERSTPFTTAPTAGDTFWIEIDICAPPLLDKNVAVM